MKHKPRPFFLRTLNSQEGFTLTELVIVVALIGILAGIVGPAVYSKFDRARVSTTKTQMKQLGNVLDEFKRECGFYPTTEQTLDALGKKPTVGRECRNYDPSGYIKDGKIPRDSFDNPFLYESDGKTYEIKSLGSDGVEGGEGNDADLSSKNLD